MRIAVLALAAGLLLALALCSGARTAWYLRTDGVIVDPILSVSGEVHPYSGPNLQPFAFVAGAELVRADLTRADLIGADMRFSDLSGAELSGAILFATDLTGAVYDGSTRFPTGGDIYSGSWGLTGGATPWDLGMVPAPEPASGLMLGIGSIALAAIARRRPFARRKAALASSLSAPARAGMLVALSTPKVRA
jgi:hypothetical protein